jgi:hypothetical protein
LFFVVRIDVVDVIPTEIGLDLDSAVVTPVTIDITNGMAEGTRKSLVIPMRLKLRIAEFVDPWDVTENSG